MLVNVSESPAHQSDQPEEVEPELAQPGVEHHHRIQMPRLRVVLLVALGVLVLLWALPTIAAAVEAINLADVEHVGLVIGIFVVFDAVIPIFPSESLLNTASTLAAQGETNFGLGQLIVAGSLGAIVGDSLLYWLSRTVLRPTMAKKVEQAQQNDKVARGMEVMSQTAPLLIVFGRFVPGLRFMVGATMGLTKYPYPRFLLWDAIGGTLWATYTCVFSYAIGSVIKGMPIVSILTSAVVTTALLALLYVPVKRHWDATAPEGAESEPGEPDPAPA